MKKTKKPINELKGIKKEDMIPVKQKKSKRKRGLYLGYYSRLIFNVIIFLSLVVTSYIFINKSIVIQEAKNVSYEEHGNTDYKVFLKDNVSATPPASQRLQRYCEKGFQNNYHKQYDNFVFCFLRLCALVLCSLP